MRIFIHIKLFSVCILLSIISINKSTAQINESGIIDFGVLKNNKKSISLSFDASSIQFNFVTFEDFANGIGGLNGEYQLTGYIKSSDDWVLSFASIEPFWHEDRIASMPLDNVGLTVKSPDYSRTNNFAESEPLPLSSTQTIILSSKTKWERGNNNPNYTFTIFWEMGTMKRNMNSNSILKQNLPKGEYRTIVEFIVRENL